MNHLPLIIEKFLNQTSPIVRFLFVGILNTLVGLSITFLFLNIFNQGYWISTFIGNCTGAVCSFLLNRTFTFKSDVPVFHGGIRFVFVILICYLFAYSFSSYIVETLSTAGTPTNEIAVLLGTVLYTILNYLGQKHIVFYRKTQTG